MTESDFTICGPSLNYCQIELLLSKLLEEAPASKAWRVLDFRPASYFGLFETLLLLVGLRTAVQCRAVPNWLKFPDNGSFLQFCANWRLLDELKAPTDYCARGLTVGYNDLPMEPLIDLQKELQKGREEAWKHANPGGVQFASSRMVQIERVTTLYETFDYTRFMHKAPVLNTLMKQLHLRRLQLAQEFADCIIFELLRNIVHHVWLYGQGMMDGVTHAESAVGFIAMQTHDDDMINWISFSEKWHPSLHPTLEQFRARGGFLEVAVADSGTGILETLGPAYEKKYGRESSSTLEVLKYACELGSSRYEASDKAMIDAEKEVLLDCFSHINEDREEFRSTGHIPDRPTKLTEYEKQVCDGSLGTGTGLALIADTVRIWGGVLLVRSKDVQFCPWLPASGLAWHEEVPNELPGVQIRVLIPKGV